MQTLLKAGVPIASSCHGEGICGKCHVKIVNGHQMLSPAQELEIQCKQRNLIPMSHRLSCQTFAMGDVTVDTDYW